MALPPLEATFQAAPDGGYRLWLLHKPPPLQPPRGAVLYVHPLAEEMNKARRMAAMTARALANDGWTVLQPDLAGCGDSSGDFEQATWAGWLDDLACALEALRARQPAGALWLWGLRVGALLCTQLAARLSSPPHLLLWQPSHQGKAVLQQFLRLKAAAQLADGGGKAILDAARADLAAGRPVDVAGYQLAPAIAHGLEQALLTPPTPPVGCASAPRLVWIETSTQPEPVLSPASQATLPMWQASGWQVQAECVNGPAFWQTTEIEDAPAMVARTTALLATAEAGTLADNCSIRRTPA